MATVGTHESGLWKIVGNNGSKTGNCSTPKAGMAGVAGLEPVTSAVTGQRSNQLSYTPAWGTKNIERFLRNVKRL